MKEGDIMNIDKLINEMNSHNKKSKKKKGVKKYIDDIKRYIYEVIYYINGITRSERIILTNNISKDFVRKSKLDWFEKKSIESDETLAGVPVLNLWISIPNFIRLSLK